MVLRSDESANQAEIERDQRFRSNVGKTASSALALGGASVGTGIASKIMPFLNEYIPVDLAIKGISKVSPKVGDFLRKGQSMGLNVEEGLQFVKDKMNPNSEPPKQNRNIIEQYDPELHTYIESKLKEGVSLLEAGKKALSHNRFKSAVDKLTKDHKVSWDTILRSVYGSSNNSTDQQPSQKPGQGQQALMEMLQKINQRLGQ